MCVHSGFSKVPWHKRAFWPGTRFAFLELIIVTKMRPSGGTKYVSFEFFLSILKGPGEGRGGTAPLQNPEVTSRKAYLRNGVVHACVVSRWL